MQKIFVSFTLSLVLWAGFSFANTKAKYEIEQFEPREIPEITFTDSENQTHKLEEYEGNLLLVSFWATWCTSCINEMQDLDQLQKIYRKKSFKILPLSIDFKGLETVKEFYEKSEIKYLPILLDSKNQAYSSLEIQVLPTALLIDQEGREIARIYGPADWLSDNFIALINRHINEVIEPEDVKNSKPKKNDKQLLMMVNKELAPNKVTENHPTNQTEEEKADKTPSEPEKEKNNKIFELPPEAITDVPAGSSDHNPPAKK